MNNFIISLFLWRKDSEALGEHHRVCLRTKEKRFVSKNGKYDQRYGNTTSNKWLKYSPYFSQSYMERRVSAAPSQSYV